MQDAPAFSFKYGFEINTFLRIQDRFRPQLTLRVIINIERKNSLSVLCNFYYTRVLGAHPR